MLSPLGTSDTARTLQVGPFSVEPGCFVVPQTEEVELEDASAVPLQDRST